MLKQKIPISLCVFLIFFHFLNYEIQTKVRTVELIIKFVTFRFIYYTCILATFITCHTQS